MENNNIEKNTNIEDNSNLEDKKTLKKWSPELKKYYLMFFYLVL